MVKHKEKEDEKHNKSEKLSGSGAEEGLSGKEEGKDEEEDKVLTPSQSFMLSLEAFRIGTLTSVIRAIRVIKVIEIHPHSLTSPHNPYIYSSLSLVFSCLTI